LRRRNTIHSAGAVNTATTPTIVQKRGRSRRKQQAAVEARAVGTVRRQRQDSPEALFSADLSRVNHCPGIVEFVVRAGLRAKPPSSNRHNSSAGLHSDC
jgi:hypothetical protein